MRDSRKKTCLNPKVTLKMLLTLSDAVLPVAIETRPAVAAVPFAVVPTVGEGRALVPVGGARLRIVRKNCENEQKKKRRNSRVHWKKSVDRIISGLKGLELFTGHIEIFGFVYHDDLGLLGPGMGRHRLDWTRVPWLDWGVSRLVGFGDRVSRLQRLRGGVSGLGSVRVSRLRRIRVSRLSRLSPLGVAVCWCDGLRFWVIRLKFVIFSRRFGVPWSDGLRSWVTGLVLGRSLGRSLG